MPPEPPLPDELLPELDELDGPAELDEDVDSAWVVPEEDDDVSPQAGIARATGTKAAMKRRRRWIMFALYPIGSRFAFERS